MAKRTPYRIDQANLVILRMELDHSSYSDTRRVPRTQISIQSRSGIRRNPDVLEVAAFLMDTCLGMSLDVDLTVDSPAGWLNCVKT